MKQQNNEKSPLAKLKYSIFFLNCNQYESVFEKLSRICRTCDETLPTNLFL